jgi:hypothetical protein
VPDAPERAAAATTKAIHLADIPVSLNVGNLLVVSQKSV